MLNELSFNDISKSRKLRHLKKLQTQIVTYIDSLPKEMSKKKAGGKFEDYKDPKTLGQLSTTVIKHPTDTISERIWLKLIGAEEQEELLGGTFLSPKPTNQLPITNFWMVMEPYFRALTEDDLKQLVQINNDPAPYVEVNAETTDPLLHRLVSSIITDPIIMEDLPESTAIELKQIDPFVKENCESLRHRLMSQLNYLELIETERTAHDELSMGIKYLQRHLRLQEMINYWRKSVLHKKAKLMLAFDQYNLVLADINREIEQLYSKKVKNRRKRKDDDETVQGDVEKEIKSLLEKRDSVLSLAGLNFDKFLEVEMKPKIPEANEHPDYKFLVEKTLHFQKYECNFIPEKSIFKDAESELKSKVVEFITSWNVPLSTDLDKSDPKLLSTILKFWRLKPFSVDHPGNDILNICSQDIFPEIE
eukprot:NODE_140_length_16098_cov_0.678605.p3 type:complete len:420 gc:universal NODE_140_length_16098_cov_0.678605:8439-7180(-)